MQDRSVAEQQVPRAGDQQAGRHAVQIRVQRRKDWVLAIRLAYIFIIGKMIWIGGLQLAGKAVQSEQLPRIPDLAEIRKSGKDSQRSREWQAQLFETNCDFAGEDRSR